MNSCCTVKNRESRKNCPKCENPGATVGRKTVLHHVKPDFFERLKEEKYWFCGSPDCPVVYFGQNDSTIFETYELREPVTQKVTGDASPVCYCFGFTEGDIRKEISTTGNSFIPGIITDLIKAGMCACEIRNPSGKCCLGNVHGAVKRLLKSGQASA